MKKLCALILALAMCWSLLAACGEKNTGLEEPVTGDEPVSQEPEQDEEEFREDIIGLVDYVGENSLALLVYEAEDTTDLAALDMEALTLTDWEETVDLDENAAYYTVSDGILQEATAEAVTQDCMVAVTYDEADNQQVTVLGMVEVFEPEWDEEAQAEETAWEQVARVTAVNDDGSLELEEFECGDEYMIGDYAEADFSSYEATGYLQTYEVPEDCQIVRVEDGSMTQVDVGDIQEADMLVIVEDAEGFTWLYVYPA